MKRIIYYEHQLYFLYWIILIKKINIKEWVIKAERSFGAQFSSDHPINKAVAFIKKYGN